MKGHYIIPHSPSSRSIYQLLAACYNNAILKKIDL